MDSIAKVFAGAMFAPVVAIIWWSAMTSLWQSDDTRLAAVVLALAGVAAVGGAVAGLYKKFASGGW